MRFQVLSDRAYRKLKETSQHEISPYKDLSEEDIHKRIAELQQKLGVAPAEPQALPPADETKPN